MENKNKKTTIENLSNLPLQELSDEALSEVMSKLASIKAEKHAHETPALILDEDEDTAAPLLDEPFSLEAQTEELPYAEAVPFATDIPMTPLADSTYEAYEPTPECSMGTEDTTEEADAEMVALCDRLVKKRKKDRRTLWIFATVIGIVLICILMVAAFLKFYRPTVDTDPPPFLDNVTDDGESRPIDGKDTGDETSHNEGPDAYQRKQDIYNFLILGIDRLAHLSDVIMIVSYDVKDNEMSVLSLPRDTYINVGSNYHKLNAYFAAAYNRSRKSEEERIQDAATAMETFLEKGLCINIDRYVCIDTTGFRDVVNAVGGVDMEVPFDMEYYDEAQDLYINLKAGYQHLNGDMAEQFVRFRSGYLNADIGRISAQRLFLTALIAQFKKSFNVSTAVTLAETAFNYVTTDLSLADIGYFAKKSLSLDMEDVRFTTLPGGGAVNPTTGASYYVMYAENARKIVNNYFNVYSDDITKDMFLANSTAFTSDEAYIAKVFAVEIPDDGTVSADDISQGKHDIPLRNQ